MADQAGDTFFDRNKYSHSFDKEPQNVLRDQKYSFPSLMETQIRKLKHGLENWREIILQGKKVFFWEKQWHSTAILGGCTVVYMFLWLLDPSILTIVSVFGLVVTLCDYLIPSIAKSIYKSEKWTARKEQEFEEVCTNIILYKARLELAWAKYYKLKSTNRKMYFGLTMTILGVLAWVGCTFNNMFLAYVFTTFLLLLPGLEHNGIVQKYSQYVHNILMEILRQKPKLQDKKD